MNTNNILDKLNVLSLNGLWQRIRYSIVSDAFVAMNGGSRGNPPSLGVDIGYDQREDGTWDTDTPLYFNPVKWDDWIKLPVRPFDFSVNTAKQAIRVPTVMIAPAYREMPTCQVSLSKDAIYERDKGVCQISGRFVGRNGGNIEHIHPISRGGAKRSWRNMVWADERLNSLKGSRTMDEMGWRVIREPKQPPRVPVSCLLKEVRHPDWRHFIQDVA